MAHDGFYYLSILLTRTLLFSVYFPFEFCQDQCPEVPVMCSNHYHSRIHTVFVRIGLLSTLFTSWFLSGAGISLGFTLLILVYVALTEKKKKLTSKECYQTMPLKYSGKSFGFCKLISVTSQKTRLGQLYHRACPFSRPSESILALQCLDIGIAPCLLWMTLLLCVSQSTTLALLFPVCVVLFLLSLRQGLLLVQRHIVSRMTPWRGFGYSLENMVSS